MFDWFPFFFLWYIKPFQRHTSRLHCPRFTTGFFRNGWRRKKKTQTNTSSPLHLSNHHTCQFQVVSKFFYPMSSRFVITTQNLHRKLPILLCVPPPSRERTLKKNKMCFFFLSLIPLPDDYNIESIWFCQSFLFCFFFFLINPSIRFLNNSTSAASIFFVPMFNLFIAVKLQNKKKKKWRKTCRMIL